MKKLNSLLIGLSVIFAVSTLISCATDDPDPIMNPSNATIENLKIGILNGLLEENFTLNPSTSYLLTGSFIVNDGVTFNVPAGTQIEAVDGGTDVYIAVLKGGKININGTGSSPVIMSSIDAQPGDWGGLTICGDATTTAGIDATAEVGGFIYGGTNDTDSSGIIKNLVIKGTGAQINSESQYNGVSFYAVGSGTVVENIAVIDGSDDGVEFFGGTVSVKNLYVENTEDDAIDWTEGWNGTIDNAYISHTIAGFSTVVEGDKTNNNPKLNNLTAISTVGGTALQHKKESGSTITNLYLSGYSQNIDMKDGGALSNVMIDGSPADPDAPYNTGTPVDISDWDFINGQILPVEVLNGNLTADKTLTADIKYSLTGSFIVQDGVTLTIEEGTKISADKGGVDVYIAVLKGGKIDVQGTAENPVIMSSVDPQPADWGGLTICGKATTTAGVDATAEVGGFIYGGNDDADNSGAINYLVIRGTGAQINSESQYNGISLYAVGSSTAIDNVAVIDGADDGIEFFGGTVSASNVYLENNEDDSIDWTEGWNGTVTNTYISHTIEGFSTAFEGDKVNNNPKFDNVTAISSVDGTALQFKKESGATITNLYLEGYDTNIDMKDGGSLDNVKIDGASATTSDAYNTGTKVDINAWNWRLGSL
ncbi:hypothetical protein [Urechidicola vernalis]|uniref:Lipoprotein n=1 Tax=Urechidicola vernalis TaxID=3075600 RepID=A0ABU2Y7C1_9FLAO|nr:hypothetical protein [Urechidicola sp. P050]MDT0553680.1 hypothetical protein [Urechidicola sp. P050]